jgi:hypothetical protein
LDSPLPPLGGCTCLLIPLSVLKSASGGNGCPLPYLYVGFNVIIRAVLFGIQIYLTLLKI